jgi:hypothetical protein
MTVSRMTGQYFRLVKRSKETELNHECNVDRVGRQHVTSDIKSKTLPKASSSVGLVIIYLTKGHG